MFVRFLFGFCGSRLPQRLFCFSWMIFQFPRMPFGLLWIEDLSEETKRIQILISRNELMKRHHPLGFALEFIHRKTSLFRSASGADQHFTGFDSSSMNKSAAGRLGRRDPGAGHIPACLVFRLLQVFAAGRSFISFRDLSSL
jgi:hypothetical protein